MRRAPAASAGSAAIPRSNGQHPADTPSAREELAAVVNAHRNDLKSMFPVPPARAPRRKQVASTAALVLLLGTGLWWLDPVYRTEQFDTQVGQIIHVDLADGSRIVLDTDSRVSVQWHLRSRRVELAQGRAHFDVAHATLRPFFVDAGPAQVRVVGTRFDVWRQGDATQVWVYQGKVAVWRSGLSPADGVQLAPGQQTTVPAAAGEEGAPLQVGALDHADRQVWRLGRLVFNDTPLDEVVATLQRYRSGPVTLSGDRLGAMTVSGVFDTANTDQLLSMLPGMLPVTLRHMDDGRVDIRAR